MRLPFLTMKTIHTVGVLIGRHMVTYIHFPPEEEKNMRNLFTKAMSTILAIAMILTLIPANFAFAATAPVYELSIVDGDGNAVDALYPGMSAYVRLNVYNIEQVYNMAMGVTAATAVFYTDLSLLNKRFSEFGILGDLFEINNAMQGAVVTESLAKFKLTKISTVPSSSLPTPTTGFVLVDVPFMVPVDTAIGAEVVFAVDANGTTTNFYPSNGAANKYTVGHLTRPIYAREARVVVTEEPYTITDLELVPAFEEHPLGAEFPGFEGKVIRATMDMDRDGVPGMDTVDYAIVTDGPADGKAFVDISSFNKDERGTYTFNAEIYDSTTKNGCFVKPNAVTVVVGDPVATGVLTANTDKVVEFKFGMSEETLKNTIALRDDLFCHVMTDGSLEEADVSVNPLYIDAHRFLGTIVGTEQIVTVTGVDGYTIANGDIRVKGLPTRVVSVALNTPWTPYPEMPVGTAFPGFDGRYIVATLDPATSYIATDSFHINTGSVVEGAAYVDVSGYDAAAMGTYDLPVIISSPILEETFEGAITLTVDAPAPTNKVKLNTTEFVLDNPEGTVSDIIAAAENLVKEADGLFSTVLTNDNLGDVATGVVATTVAGQYSEADKAVYVSISAVSSGRTLVGDMIVTVDVNTDPVITGAVRVTDVTGEVLGFGSAIPAGAVITAIKLDEDGNGGNLHNGTYTSFYTITDANGGFKLAVEPGTYKIHIAHSKYEYVEGVMYASRTIHDEFEVVLESGDDLELGVVNLYYTYFGDTDVDGDIDGDDYGMFAPMMGTAISR